MKRVALFVCLNFQQFSLQHASLLREQRFCRPTSDFHPVSYQLFKMSICQLYGQWQYICNAEIETLKFNNNDRR